MSLGTTSADDMLAYTVVAFMFTLSILLLVGIIQRRRLVMLLAMVTGRCNARASCVLTRADHRNRIVRPARRIAHRQVISIDLLE
jgi:hypothetical protein